MKKLLLLATAAAFLAALPARAAEPIQVFIKSKVTGDISGDGPDKSITALAFQHEIVSPRDAATGLPTGRRQHKPFVIVKAIDKATPVLYANLVNNSALTTVTMKFYKPAAIGSPGGSSGKPVLYYTVVLENAAISSIRNWKPNTRDLSADRAGDLEEVSFTYQKITWTFAEGGITAQDDWGTAQ